MNLDQATRMIVADLQSLRARFAVIGGLAVSVHTEPRTTRDVDLAIAVADDREAEALVRALLSRGYQLVAQLEQDNGRLSTVRLRQPRTDDQGPIVDLLFASSGIEPEIVAAAATLEILARLCVPVATREHLLAMKVLAHDEKRRPQDRIDIAALLKHTSAAEIERVRQHLQTITARGYAGKKDLLADFDAFVRLHGPTK